MFGKHKKARKTHQQIEGYNISPKAVRLVTTYCNRTRSKGRLPDEPSYRIAAAALLTAGINTAAERGVRVVRTTDIKEGWVSKLRVAQCPVEICVFRSAVMRVDELKESMPNFTSVLMSLSDKA